LLEGGDGLEVEEEVGLLLLLGRVDFADGFGELGERVGTLDHGRDDVVDADLLALDQVAHGLAAADLEPELQVGFAADLNEAQQLVDACALGLELGLHRGVSKVVSAGLQQAEHLAFQSVHVVLGL